MKHYWIILLAAVVLLGGFILGTAGAAQAAEDAISLRYDDRKDLSQLLGVTAESVAISNEQVTSKSVGTDIPDAHVLQYENGILYATGTGSATLTVNGKDYAVTVEAAPISLFMITGHSVGIGEQGNAAQSVAIEPGQAYSSHRYWTYENHNKCQLIIDPEEVTETTGLGYMAENRISGIDAFAPGGGGTIGGGSGLAWQWNQLTGEKVWVINAARGGSCLNHWIPGAEGPSTTRYKYLYESSMEAYRNAQYILKNEIAAGHFTLSHMGMIYHNGGNFTKFTGWTDKTIMEYYDQMWSSFKKDLSMDMDGDGENETVEFLGLAVPRFSTGSPKYKYDRAASYYMSAMAEYPDIFIASNFGESYATDEDLKNFPDITYTTQSEPVTKPVSIFSTQNGGSSDNSFHCLADTGHLSQVTYNLQGIDTAENIYGYLYTQTETISGKLYNANHVALKETLTVAVGESFLAVPRTEPRWATGLTLEVSGNAHIELPCKVVADAVGTATVTLKHGDQVLQTVQITILGGHTHCACVNADVIPADHECNTRQIWTALDKTTNKFTLEADGYYCLNWTGAHAASIQVAEDVNAYLCLNGATIYAKKTITLGNRASLTICDCTDGQKGTITVSGTAVGAPVWLDGNKTMTLLSGNISGSANYKTHPAVASTSSYSNFYMYGGSLIGGVGKANDDTTNPVADYGGTVQLVRGTFTMYGGTISGGRSTTYGGIVGLANNATFDMYGGTIEGGQSTTYGGAIGLDGSSVFTMYGGTVRGGTSTTYGGTIGIGSKDASITIHGGTVEGGTSTTHGAALGCGNGTVNIYGGHIQGGHAKTYGGAASVMNNTKLNIYGGKITNGTAAKHTGGIYTNKSGILLSGNPVIGEIYMNNGNSSITITLQDLTAAKSIGIKLADTTKSFATVDTDCATAFVSNMAGYGVGYTGSSLKLTTDVAQVGNSTYATLADAIVAGNEIRLLQDVSANVTITDTLYLDMNGCDLSGLTVNGKLYVIDSANRAYAENSCGTLTCDLVENGSINDNKLFYQGYVKVESEGALSFHRISTEITHISLDPINEGLGFKAKIHGDSQVLGMVDGFGLQISVADSPAKTYTKPLTELKEAGVFTLRLTNILKFQGGETPIYGIPVIVIGDEVITGEKVGTTMKDALVTIDKMEGLSNAQKAAVYNLYAAYPEMLLQWLGENNNIKNWIF